MLGRLGAAWGVVGVVALLVEATARLAILAWEAIAGGLSSLQWALLAGWVAVMVYSEGWRGFHKRFSPRVVARARHIARRPRIVDVVLAPAFCMSLYATTRRGLIVAWGLVAGITVLVLLVRTLSQPWRGIVDAGVVAGLSTGIASIVLHSARALAGRPTEVDPELPR